VVEPALYDRYAGKYQIGDLDMVFTISRDGNRLLGQFNGQFRFQMYPSSDATFFLKVDEAQVKFIRDETGAVNRLLWCQGGQEPAFTRITPQSNPEQLHEYSGEYRRSGDDLLLRKKGDLFCLSDMTVQFRRNTEGRVTGFELNRSGATWTIQFTRKKGG
jgi:hypothetical protein